MVISNAHQPFKTLLDNLDFKTSKSVFKIQVVRKCDRALWVPRKATRGTLFVPKFFSQRWLFKKKKKVAYFIGLILVDFLPVNVRDMP